MQAPRAGLPEKEGQNRAECQDFRLPKMCQRAERPGVTVMRTPGEGREHSSPTGCSEPLGLVKAGGSFL